MNRKSLKRKPLFMAAFFFLSLISVLLLVFSFQFFLMPSVHMQLYTWARQSPFGAIFTRFRAAQPVQHAQVATMVAATMQAYARTDALSAESEVMVASEPLSQTLSEDNSATPVPIIQVVEDSAPDGDLVIPRLKIDQAVVTVPVVGQEWDLSKLDAQIGWLQTTGTRPGDDLAMVFIGHITLPDAGGLGPFFELGSLQPGDTIGYRTEQATYVYEVQEWNIIPPDHIDRLYQPDGDLLFLVTCTSYNALERKYDSRLLVKAKLVDVEE